MSRSPSHVARHGVRSMNAPARALPLALVR